MKKKNQVFNETAPMLEEKFGPEVTRSVLEQAWVKFDALCAAHAGDSKAVRFHTEGTVYPCIALYDGLLKAGVDRQEAVAFLDWSHSKRAEPKAASMRMMMKLPGMYHLMPTIFKWVTVHQFGTEAGFAAHFYPTGRDEVKFDMTKCLYCDVCRREGCPELIVCFCHTDDVTNGNIHPRLCWHRTQIMGDGGKVCDFDLFVTDHK